METKKIYFGTIEKVVAFVQKAGNMDAIMRLISGTKVVDAKSLIAVFSLDLTQSVLLEVTGDAPSRQEVWTAMNDFLL